jgi:hypothetical protein
MNLPAPLASPVSSPSPADEEEDAEEEGSSAKCAEVLIHSAAWKPEPFFPTPLLTHSPKTRSGRDSQIWMQLPSTRYLPEQQFVMSRVPGRAGVAQTQPDIPVVLKYAPIWFGHFAK